MTRRLFVVGTDTGVGKTTFSVGFLVACRQVGLRVAASKPAETGCRPAHGEHLWPEDAARLCAAAGLPSTALSDVCPYRFALPAAPAVAARREDCTLALEAIERSWATLSGPMPDVLLVEGAGGLLVPYAPSLTGADLITHLLPAAVVVVARASLGTINHSALTVAELRRREIPIAGIVLNRVGEIADPSEADNAAEITALTGVPVLGTLPHIPRAESAAPDVLATAVRESIDLAALLATLPEAGSIKC